MQTKDEKSHELREGINLFSPINLLSAFLQDERLPDNAPPIGAGRIFVEKAAEEKFIQSLGLSPIPSNAITDSYQAEQALTNFTDRLFNDKFFTEFLDAQVHLRKRILESSTQLPKLLNELVVEYLEDFPRNMQSFLTNLITNIGEVRNVLAGRSGHHYEYGLLNMLKDAFTAILNREISFPAKKDLFHMEPSAAAITSRTQLYPVNFAYFTTSDRVFYIKPNPTSSSTKVVYNEFVSDSFSGDSIGTPVFSRSHDIEKGRELGRYFAQFAVLCRYIRYADNITHTFHTNTQEDGRLYQQLNRQDKGGIIKDMQAVNENKEMGPNKMQTTLGRKGHNLQCTHLKHHKPKGHEMDLNRSQHLRLYNVMRREMLREIVDSFKPTPITESTGFFKKKINEEEYIKVTFEQAIQQSWFMDKAGIEAFKQKLPSSRSAPGLDNNKTFSLMLKKLEAQLDTFSSECETPQASHDPALKSTQTFTK